LLAPAHRPDAPSTRRRQSPTVAATLTAATAL
jgi:hypothetical protein